MSKLPKFDYCIMCEDVRLELGNKVSILGFLGLAPSVDLYVAQLNQPTKIVFLFGGEGGEGKIDALIRLVGPDQGVLGEAALVGSIDPKRPKIVFGTSMTVAPLRQGKFEIQLLLQGSLHYKNTFTVHLGPPPGQAQS
jgi:hypothetical protein